MQRIPQVTSTAKATTIIASISCLVYHDRNCAGWFRDFSHLTLEQPYEVSLCLTEMVVSSYPISDEETKGQKP